MFSQTIYCILTFETIALVPNMDSNKREILSSLSEVAEVINNATDASSIAKGLITIVEKFVNVEYTSIFLWSP